MNTPVLIVGAGPAGAATSIFLSKAGIPHTIIDKAIFPRDKVCGDACSGRTFMVMNKANETWMDEIIADARKFHPSYGITFSAPNGKILEVPFKLKGPGNTQAPCFTATRLHLDYFLFQKLNASYATILQGVAITQMERNASGYLVTVTTPSGTQTIQAGIIVGADGDKSTIRKQLLNIEASPKAHAVGLRSYYSNIAGIAAQRNIEIHFLPEMQPGYLWIFPLPDGRANVGAGMLSEDVRSKKINLRTMMLQALATNKMLAPRFANATLEGKIQGWGLPMGMKQLPISGDAFLLVGDAAQLIDPFSGEGIGNALYSGMAAATAILQSIAAGNSNAAFFALHYDKALYSRIGSELRNSALLQRLSRYPSLFNFVMNKAYKSKTLREAICGMFTGTDMSKLLRTPGFYRNILINR